MMGEQAAGRAMEPLTRDHLRALGRLAAQEQDEFFARNPRYEPCRRGLLCVALCQGGALHYVDGRNGAKDLDVWIFYAAASGPTFPPRWRREKHYPDSGLTEWSERVEVLARSIERLPSPDPAASLVHYLRSPRTRTAWELAQKAGVLIEPEARIGEVIWPTGAAG